MDVNSAQKETTRDAAHPRCTRPGQARPRYTHGGGGAGYPQKSRRFGRSDAPRSRPSSGPGTPAAADSAAAEVEAEREYGGGRSCVYGVPQLVGRWWARVLKNQEVLPWIGFLQPLVRDFSHGSIGQHSR